MIPAASCLRERHGGNPNLQETAREGTDRPDERDPSVVSQASTGRVAQLTKVPQVVGSCDSEDRREGHQQEDGEDADVADQLQASDLQAVVDRLGRT